MLTRLLKPTAFKLALTIGVLFSVVHFARQTGQLGGFLFTELELLDQKALDFKFKRRGALPGSGQVVIAGIDEASVQKYGLWPWKRELVARGLKNLSDAGALAVGVDITFSDPDRSSPHLAINSLVDAILARTEPSAQTQLAVGTEPAALKEAGGTERARLAEVRQAVEAARVPDPDMLFAEAVRASPRLVLGVFGVGKAEAAAIPVEVLERDERAIGRFLIKELYERVSSTLPDGTVADKWSAADFTKDARTLIGEHRIHDIRGVQAPLPVIASAAQHVGLIDAMQDTDGTIRRYALVTRHGGALLPSLALQTAAVALDARVQPLLDTSFSGTLLAVGLRQGDDYSDIVRLIPIDGLRGHYTINYPGPKDGAPGGAPLYGKVSFADAVDGSFDPAQVKDKVVLVGATAAGTFDQRVTPFDSFAPGVLTHAAVVDNILARSFLHRSVIFTPLEVLLMLALALLFGLLVPRLSITGQLGMMFGVAMLWAGFDLAMFRAGYVLSTVMPLMEIGTLCFGIVLFNYVTVDREKRQVRHAFQHYLNKSVMEEMLRHPEKLKLGGDKRDMSVLFSDIRGFTTISERLPPEELVRTLNEYLTPMTNLVFKHEGTLDKYMGDAIMAVWGAPLPQDDHAFRACSTAVEMMKELQLLREKWRAQGRPDIDIGVGINSGLMAVGNMGSESRFDYTVMGDNVNLGSRLEGTNKEYGTNIIISEFTWAQVKGKVVARELGSVRVKGKKRPVGIYELRDVGTPGESEAKAIAAFERALVAYRARDWDEAERCFAEVLQLWPDDGPTGHYLEDIDAKRANPPPEGWDGVFEMKTK